MTIKNPNLAQEALEFHRGGKVALFTPKLLNNQRLLSLGYSPGVGEVCKEIVRNPDSIFEYTAKSNYVAVVTNGTAVLGFGNIGVAAAKPVMEGKAVLFKQFADVNAIDIAVDTKDPEMLVEVLTLLSNNWGGINLEDIKAPECFYVERELQKRVDIPIFHDDQHGTAIVILAGLMNAIELVKKSLSSAKIVINGAGAAAIACAGLLKLVGAQHIVMCDTAGVIYQGRTNGMNEWKDKHAAVTAARTLADALQGADVFIGLSVSGVLSKEMVKSMAANPIIFAMANPVPEIMPHEITEVRNDAIIATGRSDFGNQINNVMCFPYIFRGALDVRASTINDAMKIAAARAIADIVRKEAPDDEVEKAYGGVKHRYGPSYIVPVPFDKRLMKEVPVAVAQAAMATNVARKPIEDLEAYKRELVARLNPASSMLYSFFAKVMAEPKRVVFAEGEEESVLKAAIQWRNQGCGIPILIGNPEVISEKLLSLGADLSEILIENPETSKNTDMYTEDLYRKLQRKGYLFRECARLVRCNRQVFAAEMLEHKECDAMVAGATHGYLSTVELVKKVISVDETKLLFALSILLKRDKVLFIADTAINSALDGKQLAKIAIQSASEVREMGYQPRVAFVSSSNFGCPALEATAREAIAILDSTGVDFEYDGEITVEVALSKEFMKMYPFCRLTEPANILIMPNLEAASLCAKLLEHFGKAAKIGPILCGFDKSVQIVQLGSQSSEIFNAAAIAATRVQLLT